MPRRKKRLEQEIETLIVKYAQENDGASDLRDVQEYINGKLGVSPSTATISDTLRAAGLDYQASRWVWKHNSPRY